jgi:hypothetical protein
LSATDEAKGTSKDSQVRPIAVLSLANWAVGSWPEWIAMVVDFLLRVMDFGGTMESCFAEDLYGARTLHIGTFCLPPDQFQVA